MAVSKKERIYFGCNRIFSRIESYERTTTLGFSSWKTNSRSKEGSFYKVFSSIRSLTVDSRDRLIVCDSENAGVVVLTEDLEDDIDLSTHFQFNQPISVTVDELDHIFVLDRNQGEWVFRVVVFDKGGTVLNVLETTIPWMYCSSILVNDVGLIFLCTEDNGWHELKLY